MSGSCLTIHQQVQKGMEHKICTRFLQSFNLATIHHFQSEGIDKISSTWLKQICFFYSKEINKMLKSSLDGHTFLDWTWGLPKLNFGSLVGLSSFWRWDEHLDACSGCLDGFLKNHRYSRITWYGRPYQIFTRHSCPLLKTSCTKILSRGGSAVPLGSAVSPKISKTAFLSLVYLLNAIMKTNLKSKHDWCTK
jgi:hypothetical protein